MACATRRGILCAWVCGLCGDNVDTQQNGVVEALLVRCLAGAIPVFLHGHVRLLRV